MLFAPLARWFAWCASPKTTGRAIASASAWTWGISGLLAALALSVSLTAPLPSLHHAKSAWTGIFYDMQQLGLLGGMGWLFVCLQLSMAWLAWRMRSAQRAAILQYLAIAAIYTWVAIQSPLYLVHYLGVCTKYLPWAILLWFAHTRNLPLLRVGMALVWCTEGLFPKLLFHQTAELQMVGYFGLTRWFAPSTFLYVLGMAQLVAGGLLLVVRGIWLHWLLCGMLLGLFFLPLLVLLRDPMQILHPLGGLIKNIPILVGHSILLHHVASFEPLASAPRQQGHEAEA